MVELIGVLSNPVGPLKALLDGAGKEAIVPVARGPMAHPVQAARAIGARHRRPGWIVDAIVQVLADRREPMQAREVHAAVEALLGEPVLWGSVKSSLATHVSGSTPRFVRVARGRYKLITGLDHFAAC
jgi:hypothetical protein